MSDHENDNTPSPRRFFRDTKRGMFLGVCAGTADYFGMRLCAVRVLTVITTMMWPVLLVVYVAVGLLAPRKPGDLYRDTREEKFWRSMRKSPSETFSDVRYRYRQLEQRTQRMERYVTSPRFNLDREFSELEDEPQRRGY